MAKYHTEQRETILKFLKQNNTQHFCVDDVLLYFRKNNINLGRTTIYRYFEVLLNEGILRKFENGKTKSACYQYIGKDNNCNDHYHFICEECKQLFHIECNLINDIQKHVEDSHKFRINNLKTTFYGICENCIY